MEPSSMTVTEENGPLASPPALNYRDNILNKFARRTNDRILQLMQKQESEEPEEKE